jgi:Zn finger protein HypA/HybF involved in hydrogenase expression
MSGRGCPVCSDTRLSKDIVNKRLSGKGITLIGDYLGALTKTEFQCNCGHIWSAIPNNVMSDNNCPKCATKIFADKRRHSREFVNDYLISNNSDIRQVGEYITAKIKTDFQCKCGHIWAAMPHHIMAGKGCPKCSKYGFQIDKPGWIYILKFDNFIKYGIANNIEGRLNKHSKNGSYIIALSKLYEDGRIAQKWERNIKIIFGGRFVSKEIMPDGWTETLPLDKLPLLLDTIE